MGTLPSLLLMRADPFRIGVQSASKNYQPTAGRPSVLELTARAGWISLLPMAWRSLSTANTGKSWSPATNITALIRRLPQF
jgi:hypothetical protein